MLEMPQEPPETKRKAIAISFVPLLLVTAAFGVYVAIQPAQSISSFSNPNYPAGEQTTNSTSRVELVALVNSTTLRYGQSISLTVSVYNTLDKVNNVSASYIWPIANLSQGPCILNNTFAWAFYNGYYTSDNISSANQIEIYEPGIYSCPESLELRYFLFDPLSPVATAYAIPHTSYYIMSNSSGWAGPAEPLSLSIDIRGTSSDGNPGRSPSAANLQNFKPGIYTIVAGDEWGQLVLLHFIVKKGSTTQTTYSTTHPFLTSIPQCTNIANSGTITLIPCGFLGGTTPYEFVVDAISLSAPSSSSGNDTLTLTLTLSGDHQENTAKWSMVVWLNDSLIGGPSPAVMWNGTHTIAVSSVHVVAGQRYEVIIDETYSPGGPPPAGEPITNELRIFLLAS